jgi:hypothetical protein
MNLLSPTEGTHNPARPGGGDGGAGDIGSSFIATKMLGGAAVCLGIRAPCA